jgi:hypothetical protein
VAGYGNNFYGVYGNGQNYGIYGCYRGDCTNKFGYLGTLTTGAYGQYNSTVYGLLGVTNAGVSGYSASTNAVVGRTSAFSPPDLDAGVFGGSSTTRYGILGNATYGAYGQYDANNFGYVGGSGLGVVGDANGAGTPVSGSGVYGTGSSYGVYGDTSTGTAGVVGNRNGAGTPVSGSGVYGTGSSYGVYGQFSANYFGYLGGNGYGVVGNASGSGSLPSSGVGVYGTGSTAGVYGEYSSSLFGYVAWDPGTTSYGLRGEATDGTNTQNYGVYGNAQSATTFNIGVYGTATGTGAYAGYFGAGNVYIVNNLGIGDLTPTEDLSVAGNMSLGDVTNVGGASANNLCRGPGNKIMLCAVSSIIYKKDVKDLNLGLSTVKNLRPVTFKWKDSGREDLGFIAEEVVKVDPLMGVYDDEGNLSSVKYQQLTAVLTKAIQEQQQEIEQLKSLVCLDHPDADLCK